MAAVVLGLSLSVTACSDDDDDNNGSEQKKDDVNKLDTDDSRVAFRWLCVLANAQTLDDNWQSKTYEPTVGQASENNQYTRIVVVRDLDEAKQHFASLADMETSKLSMTQTVNGGEAGTMTWTPSKEGAQNLAVVDVKSSIMPHLQKIVYCTEEQTGQNGYLWDSMKGVAYYRLGDVVRDIHGYYWVCVRPSFAPDNAESHWINIYNASATGSVNGRPSPILPENICDDYNNKEKYKNVTIKLPTKLPYHRTHIYNLSNLVWALINPKAYRTETEKVGNKSKGLCGFDYGYHGEKFLNLVASYWEEKPKNGDFSLWETLFYLSRQEMSTMTQLSFYYQGYKWWWGTTADMWRYESTKYENSIPGSESGDKRDIEVVKTGFDINRYAGDPDADQKAYGSQFLYSNDKYLEGIWVIRYKRGDKLSDTGKYDPYSKIPGCEDIYRFNQKQNAQVGKTAQQQTEDSF